MCGYFLGSSYLELSGFLGPGGLFSSPSLREFSALISPNKYSVIFSLSSPSGTPIVWMLSWSSLIYFLLIHTVCCSSVFFSSAIVFSSFRTPVWHFLIYFSLFVKVITVFICSSLEISEQLYDHCFELLIK